MYKAGQIVLVKFHPNHNTELRKYRPALVISDLTEQIDPRYTLLAPLTTQKTTKGHFLEAELPKLPFLNKKSYALLWQPLTLDVERVQYVMGELPPKELHHIQRRLQKMFAG